MAGCRAPRHAGCGLVGGLACSLDSIWPLPSAAWHRLETGRPPQLGFELVATKRTATLHLYERLGFIGHAITFRRTE